MERVIRQMEKTIELINSLILDADDKSSKEYVHSLWRVLADTEKLLKEYKKTKENDQ